MKIGLVLEGGASRGVFTAGVLDYLMEQDVEFSYVIGVSAGACNAANFVSGQRGRSRRCMIHADKQYNYFGFRTFLRTRYLFDMKMVFEEMPNRVFPFDYDAYFANHTRREYVATNCLTGKPDYLTDRGQDRDYFIHLLEASSAMPGAAPVVDVAGVPYVDGGLTDSIPVRRALAMGCDKVVVIETRGQNFRMKPNKGARVIARMYRKYPILAQRLKERPRMYNRTLALIRKLEQQGRAFVFRPRMPEVKRTEMNYHTLMRFYAHGYQEGKRLYPALKEFMADS